MSRYDEGLLAPRTLTDRETDLLLRTSGERRDGFRDHVILSLALGSALREHELAALNMEDVYDEAGAPRRRVALSVFKRSHDDPEMQQLLLPERLRAKLQKYRSWKSSQGESLLSGAPLFMSRKGNRLSTRQLRRLIHVWQSRAGVDAQLGFHALRHTACTNLYRTTKDLRLTQRFARHKSVRSTTRYTHPTDEDLVRSVQDLRC